MGVCFFKPYCIKDPIKKLPKNLKELKIKREYDYQNNIFNSFTDLTKINEQISKIFYRNN